MFNSVTSVNGGCNISKHNSLRISTALSKIYFCFGPGDCNRPQRTYATLISHQRDDRDIHHDPKWPKHEYPTPYDIFAIQSDSPSQIDRKLLKKQYHEFAKLYHPDISQNIRIIRSPVQQQEIKHNLLTLDEKLFRFKVMTQAYEILSNSQKKNLYDCTKSGWSYGRSGTSGAAYAGQYPNTHGYKSNASYSYWNAGTWEEMNDLNSKEKQKLDPWTVFIWICGLVICVEATALLSRIENSLTSQQYTHDETECDLAQSYTNYGLDTDKMSRFRRFLWFRTYGLYRTKDDLDREAKRNEELVQGLKKKEDANHDDGGNVP